MPASNNPWLLRTGLGLAAAVWLSAGQAQTIRFIQVDPQQVGTMQPAEAGLSETLWDGSTREGLASAIDAIEGPSPWLAAHRALAGMLGAAAALPPAKSPDETLQPPLITRRITALARLGADSEALALAVRAPQQFRQEPLLAAEADIRLLRNDLSGACNLPVANAAATATVEWQKLRAFCNQLNGEASEATAAAMLSSLSLKATDDTFAALFLALQYPQRPKPDRLIPTEPLHAAMYRLLRLRPGSAELLPAGPALLLANLGQNPNVPIAIRTLAMERAVAANAGGVGTLVQLYLEGGGSQGVGPAYRKAAFAQSVPERLRALQDLWAVARGEGLIAQLAPLTLGVIAGLDLANAPPDFIRDALRAALLAQDPAAIRKWRNAQAAATGRPGGSASRDASYALLALAGQDMGNPRQWWPIWVSAAKPSDAQQQLVGGALGAVGEGFAFAPSPNMGANRTAASVLTLAEKAPGEAALKALAALSRERSPDLALQVAAIRSLALVHPGHARALALELAVASGL